MKIKEIQWIWQQPDWPQFTWNAEVLAPLLQKIHFKQGLLLGTSASPGQAFELDYTLDTLVDNIMTSSAIEGERPNVLSLRSSLARRLGLKHQATYPTSSRSEGLAQMILDAINNMQSTLTAERLFQWHRWLFPSNEFTLQRIQVGELRGSEPMQIVSGRLDRPTIHYEAPPREGLEREFKQLIDWFNSTRNEATIDPLIRAAILHLWFEVIHPFEDGNGRIGRALTDLALAQAEPRSIHFYNMSSSILKHRKEYYLALEQSKTMDITPWISWFLRMLDDALETSIQQINRALIKTRFWQIHRDLVLSAEQIKVLNRLLEGGEKGFEQGISASQYQKVAKVSKATATRHLADLLEKGCIEKLPGSGRSTRYQIKNESPQKTP